MALISCPHCGKQISDKAIKCPKCGTDLSKLNKTFGNTISDNPQAVSKSLENPHHNHISPKKSKKIILFILIPILLIGIGAAIWIPIHHHQEKMQFIGGQEEDNQQKETVIGSIGEDKGNDNSDQLANDSKEIAKAVNYLEKRQNWAFDEMESMAQLKGLYNDLNTFNFGNIKNKWAERLKGSKKFNDLVEEVKMSDKDEYRVKLAEFWANVEDPQIINYRNYLFHISNLRKKETINRTLK